MEDSKFPRRIEGRADIGKTIELLEAIDKEKKAYLVNFLGRDFVIFPNVFSPKYSDASLQFAEHMPVQPHSTVLEIGSGCGIIAVTLANRGAEKVVATDINPYAVQNTLENVKRFRLENIIEVRQGSVYDPLREGERFDAIYWNVPFEFVEEQAVSLIEQSVYDPGYAHIQRFIKDAGRYLNPNGRLFIGFSTTLGRFDLLEKYATDAGFDMRIVYEFEPQEFPIKCQIFEMAPRKQDSN